MTTEFGNATVWLADNTALACTRAVINPNGTLEVESEVALPEFGSLRIPRVAVYAAEQWACVEPGPKKALIAHIQRDDRTDTYELVDPDIIDDDATLRHAALKWLNDYGHPVSVGDHRYDEILGRPLTLRANRSGHTDYVDMVPVGTVTFHRVTVPGGHN